MMFGYGWALGVWDCTLVCLTAGFCIIVVGAVYWLARVIGSTGRSDSMATEPSPPPDKSSTKRMLNERFARGEIEYGDRLATLCRSFRQ